MIDGGIVVGYLTAYLLKGGKRLADTAFESLLESLAERVKERLGPAPLTALNQHPKDPGTEGLVKASIDNAMAADPSFAAQLTGLIQSLNERGGQQFVNEVYAQTSVQHFGTGPAVGRDFYYAPPPPDPSDMSGAPGWVKFFAVLGAVLCLAAFALFGYTLFNESQHDLNDPPSSGFPPGIAQAAVIFFIGFLFLGVASMGRAFSKRPSNHPW